LYLRISLVFINTEELVQCGTWVSRHHHIQVEVEFMDISEYDREPIRKRDEIIVVLYLTVTLKSPQWWIQPTYLKIRGDNLYLAAISPLQSVPITTKVVSSNHTDGEVYSIQHYVIKFVNDMRQVCGFRQVLCFPPPIKLTATI
jgi:hypothetical protein